MEIFWTNDHGGDVGVQVADTAAELGSRAWVDSRGAVEPCINGIHARRIEDLGWWLSAQLWEIELAGDLVTDEYSVVASRGRLVRRVGVGPRSAGSWPNGRYGAAGTVRWPSSRPRAPRTRRRSLDVAHSTT